jgi:hypothetical protein
MCPFSTGLSRKSVGVQRLDAMASRASGGVAAGGERPLGRRPGELVVVELEQVVGGHAEPPFGPDGGSSAAVEAGDAAAVFGVAEHGLDDVLPPAVAPSARVMPGRFSMRLCMRWCRG